MLLACVFLHVETAGPVDSSFVSVHASMVALQNAALAQPHGERSMNVPANLISLLVAPRTRSDYIFLLRWRKTRCSLASVCICAAVGEQLTQRCITRNCYDHFKYQSG